MQAQETGGKPGEAQENRTVRVHHPASFKNFGDTRAKRGAHTAELPR